MNRIITISREYGAGGHSIGQKVAERLGIPFYDRDIVRATAKEGGFEPELVEREQEEVSRTNSILKSICTVSSSYFNDSQEAIHEIQKAIILRLAMKGPCVILGRCADVILTEAGIETFNVFIHADDVHRAVRVSEITGIKNATELQKAITKKDNSRHNYYNHYAARKWGDSRNYDLSLNSGVIGYEKCVQLIIDAVQEEE